MTQAIRFPIKLARLNESTADISSPAVRGALQSAWRLVNDGDQAAARLMCAATIAANQPMLARDAGLLLDTVTVLAAARGFRAIERLLAATSGRSVRVRVEPVRPPDTGSNCAGCVERYTISETCLQDPWLTRQWSEQLLGHPAA